MSLHASEIPSNSGSSKSNFPSEIFFSSSFSVASPEGSKGWNPACQCEDTVENVKIINKDAEGHARNERHDNNRRLLATSGNHMNFSTYNEDKSNDTQAPDIHRLGVDAIVAHLDNRHKGEKSRENQGKNQGQCQTGRHVEHNNLRS